MKAHARRGPIAVRMLDLSQPLGGFTDVAGYAGVRVFVKWRGRLIGSLDIAHGGGPIDAVRLRDAVVSKVGHPLLMALLQDHLVPAGGLAGGEERLPPHIPVSMVLATYDRPDDLRACLRTLKAQDTCRPVEIIVVDNHPPSGVTPPVVAEFPGVILMREERRGLSYARNRGFGASGGEIVVTVDDDVLVPRDWLERLLAPFIQPNVMAVTGNVLPLELDSEAQLLFEVYGGLGRGFRPLIADGKWFARFKSAVPTWKLGATANAAFRSAIFGNPAIGLLDEALGVGAPTGCSEDTYLFYKILRAGYAIAYEPSAYVWHKHRRELGQLSRQLYNYSKGHVAYQLITLSRHGDLRALVRLFVELPQVHLRRLVTIFRGKSVYLLGLLLREVAGNLAGPWALWRAQRRVRRLGRSDPYVSPRLRLIPLAAGAAAGREGSGEEAVASRSAGVRGRGGV